jgi:hypothetical protein
MNPLFSSSQRDPRSLRHRLLTVECLEDRCTPSQVASFATLGVVLENNSTQASVISLQTPAGQSSVVQIAATSHPTDAGDSGSQSDLSPTSQEVHPVEPTGSSGNNVFQTGSAPSAANGTSQEGDTRLVSGTDNRESLEQGQPAVSNSFSAPTAGKSASSVPASVANEVASEHEEGQATSTISLTVSSATGINGSGARLAVPAVSQAPAIDNGNEEPTSSTGNGAHAAPTAPAMAVSQPNGQTSANQNGNLNSGVLVVSNATNLFQNFTDRGVGASHPGENGSLPVHSVPQVIAGSTANPLTIPDNTTSPHESLSNPELFAPLLQIADLFQNPSLGNVGDLDAGIRHFLNDLTESVEQVIEMPGHTSLGPWAIAAVFSVAALELTRRELQRLAVKDVPDQLATTGSSGFRHRMPRTPS